MSETDPPSQTTEIFTTNGRNKSKTIPHMAMNLRIESELVGGWATHLKKYARQFGSWNPNFRDENKQIIWNHHLVFQSYLVRIGGASTPELLLIAFRGSKIFESTT